MIHFKSNFSLNGPCTYNHQGSVDMHFKFAAVVERMNKSRQSNANFCWSFLPHKKESEKKLLLTLESKGWQLKGSKYYFTRRNVWQYCNMLYLEEKSVLKPLN